MIFFLTILTIKCASSDFYQDQALTINDDKGEELKQTVQSNKKRIKEKNAELEKIQNKIKELLDIETELLHFDLTKEELDDLSAKDLKSILQNYMDIRSEKGINFDKDILKKYKSFNDRFNAYVHLLNEIREKIKTKEANIRLIKKDIEALKSDNEKKNE